MHIVQTAEPDLDTTVDLASFFACLKEGDVVIRKIYVDTRNVPICSYVTVLRRTAHDITFSMVSCDEHPDVLGVQEGSPFRYDDANHVFVRRDGTIVEWFNPKQIELKKRANIAGAQNHAMLPGKNQLVVSLDQEVMDGARSAHAECILKIRELASDLSLKPEERAELIMSLIELEVSPADIAILGAALDPNHQG